jgi:hypothetical protein
MYLQLISRLQAAPTNTYAVGAACSREIKSSMFIDLTILVYAQ